MASGKESQHLLKEKALIEKILNQKDQQAFSLLVRPYLPGLRRYLYISHRGDLEKVKEAEQDILLKLHTNLHSFRGDSQFKTWFYSLAKRKNIDILRKISRKRRHTDFYKDTLTECMDPQPTPEEKLLQTEKKQMVIDALLALPERDRRVLQLKEIEGLSVSETAAVLNIPEGTVKSRLSKGRKKLAWAYEKLRGGREGEGYND